MDKELGVSRISEGLVIPSTDDDHHQTYSSSSSSGGVLELSSIDKLPVLRCNARTLHVFKHGPRNTTAQIIRTAFSKALLPYYPLAGRLNNNNNNNDELVVECCGQGIWFVEAVSDAKLADFDYFEDVLSIPAYHKLLPNYNDNKNHDDDSPPPPLVLVQVTQFACDGFVMGLIFCHTICDGLGAAQFLNAVGELARGVEQLSVVPLWCRDLLARPLPNNKGNNNVMMMIPPAATPDDYQLEHAKVDISLDHINRLKQTYLELMGQSCSTFEIVAALLWSSRTKAIGGLQQQKLVFFANCRHLLGNIMMMSNTTAVKYKGSSSGYYGNCFFPVTITASCGALMQASIPRVIKMIQEAKARLPTEFQRWITKGGAGNDDDDDDPFAPPISYNTLFISEWGRLGFNQVDYGWGLPLHVIPVQGSSLIPVSILTSHNHNHNHNHTNYNDNNKGICRLMTWCVHKSHLHSFLDYIHQTTSY